LACLITLIIYFWSKTEMQIKSLFKVSAIVCAISLVGCGGDIKITPTVNDNSTNTDNSVNNSNNTSGGGSDATVECASYTADAGLVEGNFDGLVHIIIFSGIFLVIISTL
jgi:hypothetical protein